MIAEPNKRFEKDELKFIKDAGLIEPNELLKLDKGKLTFLKNNVKARRDAISSEIGAFKRKKAKTESDFTKHQNNLEVQDIFEQISTNNCKRFRCFPVRKERIGDQKI